MERARVRLSPLSPDLAVPSSAPDRRLSWRPVGAAIHALPDVVYPYDPAVLRAIRTFDPHVVPVMVVRAYRAQSGELRLHRYHAVASYYWNHDYEPWPWTRSVLTPTRGAVVRPTHLDLHLEDRTTRRGDGLPGLHLPFDWRVYPGLRSQWQDWTGREVARYVDEVGAATAAARRVARADERTATLCRQDRRWLVEKVANILTENPARLRRAMAERASARRRAYADLGAR